MDYRREDERNIPDRFLGTRVLDLYSEGAKAAWNLLVGSSEDQRKAFHDSYHCWSNFCCARFSTLNVSSLGFLPTMETPCKYFKRMSWRKGNTKLHVDLASLFHFLNLNYGQQRTTIPSRTQSEIITHKTLRSDEWVPSRYPWYHGHNVVGIQSPLLLRSTMGQNV